MIKRGSPLCASLQEEVDHHAWIKVTHLLGKNDKKRLPIVHSYRRRLTITHGSRELNSLVHPSDEHLSGPVLLSVGPMHRDLLSRTAAHVTLRGTCRNMMNGPARTIKKVRGVPRDLYSVKTGDPAHLLVEEEDLPVNRGPLRELHLLKEGGGLVAAFHDTTFNIGGYLPV